MFFFFFTESHVFSVFMLQFTDQRKMMSTIVSFRVFFLLCARDRFICSFFFACDECEFSTKSRTKSILVFGQLEIFSTFVKIFRCLQLIYLHIHGMLCLFGLFFARCFHVVTVGVATATFFPSFRKHCFYLFFNEYIYFMTQCFSLCLSLFIVFRLNPPHFFYCNSEMRSSPTVAMCMCACVFFAVNSFVLGALYRAAVAVVSLTGRQMQSIHQV